jgi:hypothetical protein
MVAAPLLVALLCASLISAAHAEPARTASATPKPGRYTGFVGPFSLSFKVSAGGRQITDLVTGYDPGAECSVPTNGQSERFPALSVRKGSFTGSTTLAPPSGIEQFFSIKGSFSSSTRAAGTMHGHFSIPHNALPPCSNTSTFTAQRVGG